MQTQPNGGDHRRMIATRTPGVFKRGGGYTVTFRDANGKPRKRSARTYDAARKLKAKLNADVARGEYHEASNIAFRDYFLEWVERYQGRGRRGFRESTREDYRRLGEKYALRFFGDRLKLAQLTPRHIANFIGWLCDEAKQGQPLADATVRNALNPVRSCLGTAVQEGLIRHNPAQGAALPYRPDPDADDDEDRRALSREELANFLRVVDVRHRVFFKLLASTGLRISEALALQWKHLHLDGSNPHVRVRRAITRGRIEVPKTRYGRRNVPLDYELVRDFRQRKEEMADSGADELVFPSKTGGFLDRNNLRRRTLVPAAEEAGASWAGFHTFRHTCASLLFGRGSNAVQVQRWLGHHSPAFTLSYYIHLLPNELGDGLSLRDELGSVRGAVATAVATDATDTNGGEPHSIPALTAQQAQIPEWAEANGNAEWAS
jgi:integrase